MKTPNARPDRCEVCGGRLPVGKDGRPRAKQVQVWGRHRIPTGLVACEKCHHDWLHPAGRLEVAGLPLFTGLTT